MTKLRYIYDVVTRKTPIINGKKKSHICTILFRYCVTLTFAERNRLALSLSGNKPLSAN